MTVLKPENDQDLLKELESIENVGHKIQEALRAIRMDNRARIEASYKISVIRELAKNCQEYVKSKYMGIK